MLKKIIPILLVLLITSTSAYAALKVVDPELEEKYFELAKEQIQDVEGIEAIEGWVNEFRSLGIDVYCVSILTGENKYLIYINMETKEILTEDEYYRLFNEEAKEQQKNPIYTITKSTEDSEPQTTDGEADLEADDLFSITTAFGTLGNNKVTKYGVPAIGVLILAGALLMINKKR